MIAFVVAASALVLAALGLLLWPLLRRSHASAPRAAQVRLAVIAEQLRAIDQAHAAGEIGASEHADGVSELHRQAAQALATDHEARDADTRPWPVALALALVFPLGVLVAYAVVGQPSSLMSSLMARTQGGVQAVANGVDPEHAARTAELAERLAAKLATDDSDVEAWTLLARTYRAAGQTEQALDTYRQAQQRYPAAADVMIEHASVLVERDGRRFSEQTDALVARALEAEPDNLNALAMAGAAAMQRGDRGAALQHWKQLHALVPEGSEDRERAASLVAAAAGTNAPAPRSAGPGTAVAPAAPGPAAAPAATSSGPRTAAVSGTVSVSDALSKRLDRGGTLFVFARASEGQPMPIAVVRLSPATWPAAFTLDDSHSMVEGTKLSSFGRVRLMARFSREGNATRRPGDVEGSLDAVALGSRDLRLVIDRVVE